MKMTGGLMQAGPDQPEPCPVAPVAFRQRVNAPCKHQLVNNGGGVIHLRSHELALECVIRPSLADPSRIEMTLLRNGFGLEA